MPLSFLSIVLSVIIEAIFPVPKAEQWIFDAQKDDIFKILPRAYKSPTAESFSIFSYKDEKVWRMIWSIKYKKSKQASALAGFALHRFIKTFTQVVPTTTKSSVINPNIIVVPMPVSRQRRRERGFNQCELLTAEIAKLELETGENNKIKIVNNLLVRTRHTSRQTLKDKSHRLKNAQELFSVNEGVIDQNLFKDTTFIIIDDVVTTGSTMKEAILTMRKVGFANTWGLSVAH